MVINFDGYLSGFIFGIDFLTGDKNNFYKKVDKIVDCGSDESKILENLEKFLFLFN